MIKILKYRAVNKPPLVGFLDIEIDAWNLEIRDLSMIQMDGKRWFNLPTRPYTNENGEKKYAPIVKFTEDAVKKRFLSAVGHAFDEYCRLHQ
ncbi:MAG: hypothetical protein GWN00_20345 [Aliifodinibius sp.]|nr:hypothetical protein [candidate division Zixibacteria bacterium]NIT58489.1 hypothetical protein [Fodinibius sp.]NIW46204.1 hypothetical protein [Gammaproteobacteria bacterium]NIR65171.1 hypothetical protein [candidate division Zixibacteria bacterium]NIS46903.1 hypothetical protein [candidate division Zixibacteria bacterium]